MDLLNGIIITLGIVIGLPYLVLSNGGVGEIAAALPEGHLTVLGGHNVLWVIGVAMPTFLLILGESGMYQKFFSARDAGSAKKAVVGMFLGVVFIETTLALIAIVGRAVFPELADPEQVSLVGRAASETIILHIAANGLPIVGGADSPRRGGRHRALDRQHVSARALDEREPGPLRALRGSGRERGAEAGVAAPLRRPVRRAGARVADAVRHGARDGALRVLARRG